MTFRLFLSSLALFVLFSFSFFGSVGASSEMWSKTYGNGTGHSLVETSDGGFAIAAAVYGGADFWLVKTDSYGNMEWNQTYEAFSAHSLVEASDGGYAIVGGNGLVKTDADGNLEWNQTYGGSGYDYANSLIETSDGGYLLAGNTGLWLVESKIWIIKTDEQGNIEWDKRYGGREQSGANSVVKTSDGGYALAGYLSGDFLLIKIDESGNIKWNQTYSKSDVDEAYSLVETSDGGYALAGYTRNGQLNTGVTEGWLVKTDASGNEIWSQTYGGTGNQYIHSLVETSDGAFALAGYKSYTYPDPPELWLIKTDKYGNIPEFPSWIILPLFLTATLVVIICKKRLPKNLSNQQ